MTKNLPESSLCSKTLWETRVKDDGLIKLAYKFQGEPSMCAMPWLLLAAQSQCNVRTAKKQVERFRKWLFS